MQNKHAQGHMGHWHSDLWRKRINKRRQAQGTKQEHNKGVSTPSNGISDLPPASLGFLVCPWCTYNQLRLSTTIFYTGKFTPPEFPILTFTGVCVCVCEITTFHNKTLFIF